MASPRTRFYLDKMNAKWSGVCAGIADYTGIDVTLVRVGVIGLTFLTANRWSSMRATRKSRSSGKACAPTRAAPPATSARASATSTGGWPTWKPM